MQIKPGSVSRYNQHTGDSRIATGLSLKTRKKMYQIFAEKFRPSPEMKILDVGVTSDCKNDCSNYFEKFYPYKERITCVGTEDAAWLEKQYSGIQFHRIKPHTKLPFADGQFDVVFSNAVVEHAGNGIQQREFISELLRVSKAFFITTPNRWFPVEMHTMLPLLHCLPAKWWRKCLRLLGYEYYSEEANLNLLDRKSLSDLFPSNKKIEIVEVRTLGFVSNIIALSLHPQ